MDKPSIRIYIYVVSDCLVVDSCCYLSTALVNKGNVLFNKGDFEKAREFYKEALQNDSSCVEARYNLGALITPTLELVDTD